MRDFRKRDLREKRMVSAFCRRLLPVFAMGVLVMSFSCPVSYAQDLKLVAPKRLESDAKPVAAPEELPLKEVKSSNPKRILLDRLSGLVFLRAPEKVLKGGIKMEGILADGYMPESFFEEMETFLNEPLSLEKLNEMMKKVVVYFRSQSTPVVDVYVPEQDISGGTVQIVVQEGRVGEIRAEGNEWFASDLIEKQVRVKPGDVIRGDQLAEDVNRMNKNPFRRVDLVLARGEERGETDVVLRTEDRFPLRFYGGYENTGTSDTGEDRYFTGFNWGNAFGLGHLLDYQFTSSEDYKGMNAHSLHYEIPLTYRQTLSFFGAWAESNPNIAPYDMTAESLEFSGRYMYDFSPVHDYRHNLTFGVDYKYSNSSLGFSSEPVFDKDVVILQAVLAYGGSLPDDFGTTAFSIQAVGAPGGLVKYNDTEHFNDFQEGTAADYVYFNLDIDRITLLPYDFTWNSKAHGQLANDQLLGSEQIGLGGYTSIRGFQEREANVDNGLLLINELRTPSIDLAKAVDYSKSLGNIQFLAFWDYGFGRNIYKESNETLSGYGLGVRYNYGPYVSLRLDYGLQDRGKDIDDSGDSEIHFGLVIGY